jgi:hypothetical protein
MYADSTVADPGGVRWVRPHPPSDLILSFFLTIFFRTNVFLRHPHPPSGLILPFPSNFLSEVRIFVSFAPSFKNFWIRPCDSIARKFHYCPFFQFYSTLIQTNNIITT